MADRGCISLPSHTQTAEYTAWYRFSIFPDFQTFQDLNKKFLHLRKHLKTFQTFVGTWWGVKLTDCMKSKLSANFAFFQIFHELFVHPKVHMTQVQVQLTIQKVKAAKTKKQKKITDNITQRISLAHTQAKGRLIDLHTASFCQSKLCLCGTVLPLLHL